MKFIISKEQTINSLQISKVFEREHSHVMTAIKNILGDYDIVESYYINSQNKEQPMIILNKRQALIAMPFIGGEKSIEGQIALVDAYLEYEIQYSIPIKQQIVERLDINLLINIEYNKLAIEKSKEIALRLLNNALSIKPTALKVEKKEELTTKESSQNRYVPVEISEMLHNDEELEIDKGRCSKRYHNMLREAHLIEGMNKQVKLTKKGIEHGGKIVNRRGYNTPEFGEDLWALLVSSSKTIND